MEDDDRWMMIQALMSEDELQTVTVDVVQMMMLMIDG